MASFSVGFAKCFMLFMAVVILVQGLAFLGLSLWGLTHSGCEATTQIENNPLRFAMDLIYFADKECGDPKLNIQGNTIELQMNWDKSYEITHREYIFMMTYAVVSGCWIASSVFIILTLCFATTKLITGVVYWPWFLSVLAGCILDVVATVFHAIDLSNTLSLEDAFNYVGVENTDSLPNAVMVFFQNLGIYFSTPAVIMLCISCRVVVIWLLNLIGGIFCLTLANNLAKQTAAKTPAYRNQEPPTRQATPQPMPVMTQAVVFEQVQPEPTAPMSVTPQSMQEELQYPEQIRPRPLSIVVPATNPELLQHQDSRQYQANDRTTLQSPVMVLPPIVPQQQPAQELNSYRNTTTHPDQLNYPADERPTSPAVQQLATGSALNSRYSELYPTPPANPRISEELRNQMPWSYTSAVNKPPPPPRKPQQQVQIYPQIPEPDYGEH
ncbi:CG1246 [Drosophila busckii]|uniref:CG1246 n=1 Tax=Drosophila busckii TaxID=30019 RepID=A0A0M4E8T2_DROBS|nr:uncharacterized protein LOC108600278 [Drosophila busckii]XP_017843235.1 uncharacterized protein LOC108600278 [Drosophila busckii]ALC43354.1 CG1246 [Drosophila busckii]